MALIDSYRRNVANKKGQKIKALRDRAREMDRISKETKRILDAKHSIQKTKFQSTVNSKLKVIQRAEKNLSDLNKKIAKLDEKISQLDKEIIGGEKKVRKEEEKTEAQRLRDEKKRILETKRQTKKLKWRLKTRNISRRDAKFYRESQGST